MVTKFKRQDYVNEGRWVQPPLSGCFWAHCSATASARELMPEINLKPILFLDGNGLTHIDDKKAIKDLAVGLYKNGKLRTLYERVEAVGEKYEDMHISLLQDEDLNLDGYLKKLFHTYQELAGMWWYSIMIGDVMQEYVLEEGIVASEQDMIDRLSGSHKTTWLEQQSREIDSLAKAIKQEIKGKKLLDIDERVVSSHEELYRELKRHVAEFSWFGTHHWMGDGYTMNAALSQIRDVLDKGIKDKKAKTREVEHGDLWELLALLTYGRTHWAEVTAKVVFHSRGRLTECAKLWDMTYDELLGISSREILKFVDSDDVKPELPTNYKERREAYGCYIDDDGEEQIVTGTLFKEIYDEVVKVDVEEDAEIKGTVASMGEPITGIVKVLIEPKDFDKFNKGDILVAPETTPDFVPAMKLAAAIVTDRGGITSHASIVSRELGIPCIIGTSIGTQVLKDGVKVRVDTTSGRVEIVE